MVVVGYIAGGKSLLNRDATLDDVNDWIECSSDDAIWALSTISARGAVVYKNTGTSTTSPLIAYIDFGTDKTSVVGDFSVNFSNDGMFKIV